MSSERVLEQKGFMRGCELLLGDLEKISRR